jgi:hypothetical protein
MADMAHSTPSTTITLDEKLTDADARAPARSLHDHSLTPEKLPYWQVNVPPSQRTEECPRFLRDLSPKAIRCMSIPDDQYIRQDWAEVKEIISQCIRSD